MELWYRIAADAVVVVHLGYVAFIVAGLAAVLAGIAFRWSWTRNAYFRGLHLVAIAIVVVESLCDITCPLTTWEWSLRIEAGDETYQGDFLANWAHDLLFFDAEPWVFTLAYCGFGLAVLAAFVLAPPRFSTKV